MKQAYQKRLAALLLALTLLCTLTACSGGSKYSMEAPASSAAADSEMSWSGEGDVMAAAPTSAPTESRESGAGGSVYVNSNAKLIRRAQLEIQSTQFDEAVLALQDIVSACEGYFEQSNLYGGGYRDSNALRWGSYTVRVPAEQYDRFLDQSGDIGYVVSRSESSEDIGEPYYDTEARLKTQETKRDRLLELLAKAESMEDIIQLESALSDVEYQIESFSSTLNRYDGLVSYATITIDINETLRVQEEPGAVASLGQRMGAGLSASLTGFADGFLDLLVWVSYHAVGLVVFFALAGVAVVVAVKKTKKHTKKKNDPALPAQEDMAARK